MVKKVFVGQVTEGVLTPNPVLNTSLVSMAGLLVLWPIADIPYRIVKD